MDETLEGRVETLERAVTDGDHDLSALADDAEALDRLAAAEDRIDELEAQVDELEAATQALRGYVGNIRSVNSEVEQRADAALAKAEEVADALEDADGTENTTDRTETTNGLGSVGANGSAGDNAVENHRSGRNTGTGLSGAGRGPPAEADTSMRTGQCRSGADASTASSHHTGTPDGGRAEPVDSGGAGSDHCRACGRPHGDQHESGTSDVFDAGGSSENLVESGEAEPGTLERIREML